MAHNPPSPDRFLQSSPLWQAMGIVLERYGEIFSERAQPIISLVDRAIRRGECPHAAMDDHEARLLGQRAIDQGISGFTAWSRDMSSASGRTSDR